MPIGQSQATLPGQKVDSEAHSSSSFPPSGYVDLDAPIEAEPWREDQQEGDHHVVYQGTLI